MVKEMEKIKDLVKKMTAKDWFVLGMTMVSMAVLMTLADCSGDVALAMGTLITTAGGKHLVDGPLTTADTEAGSPGLLRNEIDRRIVKIRPMSTPIDQISRSGGCRPSGSMKVEYYSVDTKPTESVLTSAVTSGSYDSGSECYTIKVEHPEYFSQSDTILLPTFENEDGESVVGYVVAVVAGGLKVKLVNCEPSVFASPGSKIESGSPVVRMGRAATELEVQTSQFEALPTKKNNLCQIFKAQVEQSTYQKIADKEVGWNFTDQEEVAIIDMRMGMEKSFLFGSKARFTEPEKHEEVLMTGGIWNQAGREWQYDSSEKLTMANLVSMMRMAFTRNCGSSRKILVAGSGLIEQLNTLEYSKVIGASTTVTKWGIDFTELRSKFGTLYVVHSEVMDSCNHENDGLIIDPEYMTKYSHVPFRTERLDLKKSGIRNTEAVVITEASCLVLRYPDAHVRVVAKK
ncbi:MAG: DUF5309 family protein [Muribaculaceae bacterium]|nr:DUF5309 family protein [Muribaculaceae bacterium]